MMNDVVSTVEYRGMHIDIYQDPDPEDPREWGSDDEMICFHRKYNIGDKHNYLDVRDMLISKCLEKGVEYAVDDEPTMDELIKSFSEHYLWLPIYMYEHSGITINTTGFSCSWDSGQIGIICISKDKVKELYAVDEIDNIVEENIYGLLKADVENYDQYITGDVYGYMVREIGQGCWGFYGGGEDSMLIEDAKDCIDYYLAKEHPLFESNGIKV